MNKGILSAFISFILWGSLPLYWKLLPQDPIIVLSHRIIWSFIFLRIYLLFSKEKSDLPNKAAIYRSISILFNWGVYIWSVHNGHIIASSVGYFIAPLFYMITGIFIDKEKLSKSLISILILITISALNLSITHREDLIIALTLAFSINIYGYIQRYHPCRSTIIALEQEALCLTPFAIAWLIFQNQLFSTFTFNQENILLFLSGPATVFPLLFYGYSIKRINLTLFAMITFISPSIQFLLATFLFHEPIDHSKLLSLALVWVAVLIYISNLHRKFRLSKTRKLSI